MSSTEPEPEPKSQLLSGGQPRTLSDNAHVSDPRWFRTAAKSGGRKRWACGICKEHFQSKALLVAHRIKVEKMSDHQANIPFLKPGRRKKGEQSVGKPKRKVNFVEEEKKRNRLVDPPQDKVYQKWSESSEIPYPEEEGLREREKILPDSRDCTNLRFCSERLRDFVLSVGTQLSEYVKGTPACLEFCYPPGLWEEIGRSTGTGLSPETITFIQEFLHKAFHWKDAKDPVFTYLPPSEFPKCWHNTKYDKGRKSLLDLHQKQVVLFPFYVDKHWLLATWIVARNEIVLVYDGRMVIEEIQVTLRRIFLGPQGGDFKKFRTIPCAIPSKDTGYLVLGWICVIMTEGLISPYTIIDMFEYMSHEIMLLYESMRNLLVNAFNYLKDNCRTCVKWAEPEYPVINSLNLACMIQSKFKCTPEIELVACHRKEMVDLGPQTPQGGRIE